MSKPIAINADPLWNLDMDELRAITRTVKVGKFRLEADLDDTNSRDEDCRFIILSRGGQDLARVILSLDEAGEVVAQAAAVGRGADTAFSHLAVDLVETLVGKVSDAAEKLVADQEEARTRAEREARAAEDAEIETDLRNSLIYLGM